MMEFKMGPELKFDEASTAQLFFIIMRHILRGLFWLYCTLAAFDDC